MRRREFITLLGGAAAWPLAARAQQPKTARRVGVLVAQPADDPQSQARNAAFLQGLGELGWHVGRNLHIDYRWGGTDFKRFPTYVAELLGLGPEVILAVGASIVGPLLQATHTVPVVFIQVADPVGSGFVSNLARPTGNATGFALFEFGISAKWIDLLKELAPRVTRAAVLLDPTNPTGFGQLGAIQSTAPSLGVEVNPISIRDKAEIEQAVVTFGRGTNDGMIVLPGAQTVTHREFIIALAARQKLPTVYPYPFYVTGGGLICYGPNELEQYRKAAGYVDRILKGEKPADLPVQAADQVRAGDQPQDRQGARPRNPADPARPRRRGDRMRTARVHHAARRRGGVAAGGAAQQAERMRRIGVLLPACHGRCGISGPPRGVPAGAAAIRLDRSAATCGSTSAGARAMPTAFANTRRNWSRLRRTSSWPMAARPWGRCCRRPALCRSCSRSSAIRSAPASSTAWRGRAATPPASCCSNTA